MSIPRFYCPQIQGDSLQLDESESHHALHVLRLKSNDAIEVFDGAGRVAQAIIAEAGRRTVRCDIRELQTHEPPQRPKLTVAAAAPRGDRLRSLVEKLTELGVDHYVPLRTARSVADPGGGRIERLQATVIAAMKQSGRNHLMQVDAVTDLSAVLRNATSDKQRLLIAHPEAASREESFAVITTNTVLLIGPEGGFTAEEVLRASDYDAERISWTGGILRIETAAVVFSALTLHRMSNS